MGRGVMRERLPVFPHGDRQLQREMKGGKKQNSLLHTECLIYIELRREISEGLLD